MEGLNPPPSAAPVPIGGVVRDAAGRPVAVARVAFTAGPGPLPEIAALTDAEGRFVLSAPQPGRYELAVHGEDGSSAAATVDVPAAGADVVIELSP